LYKPNVFNSNHLINEYIKDIDSLIDLIRIIKESTPELYEINEDELKELTINLHKFSNYLNILNRLIERIKQ
jgi:hypothetical protein